jgi:DNA-binding PadR family transcriptional regulator
MGSKFQVKISGPRFYQLVKRMEESGFLRSQKGTPLTASLSMYQMTTLGRDEIDKAKAWYR